MDDPSAALAALTGTMDNLEAAVAALLAQPLNETLGDLGPLERAKLDVLIAYAINNLAWVYLRARGIDPATHDVSRELERIQTYYGKVKAVENPPTSRPRIDREAAHRFVRHNLPNSRSLPSLPVKAGAELPSTSAAATAAAQAKDESDGDYYVGTASRFRHVSGGGEKVLPGSEGEFDDEVMEVDEGSSDEADALLGEVFGREQDDESASEEGTPSGGKRKRFEE